MLILLVKFFNFTIIFQFLFTRSSAHNLSCYQCVRYGNERCGNESLLQCPPVSDRCVTHISQNEDKGYVIKRECGLGPCGFEDDMVNRGLGLDGCDRSKDEYFCVSCCRTNGCNRNLSHTTQPNLRTTLALTASVLITFYLKN